MKKLSILTMTFLPLLLISYNGFGQKTEEWAARYSGPDNKSDQARWIATDGSGNVIVSGTSGIKKGGFANITTVKYSPAGIQQFVARYNGPSNTPGNEYPYALAVDNADNIYVTGRSMGSGSNVDIVTIKYNSSLAEQWVRRYNGPENLNDIPGDIKVDATGNVFVTGYTGADFPLSGGKAIVTLKYNSSGALQSGFPLIYDALPNDGTAVNREEATSLDLDGNGSIFVTGKSVGLLTIKYNSLGQMMWSRSGNGTHGQKVIVDGSDNVVVSSWGDDYVTVKYNSSGSLLWEAFYNGPGNAGDGAWDMALDASGNVYVTGYSDNGLNDDYATVKYNSNGIQQWVTRYSGSGNDRDFARAIAVDADGNAYVTGSTSAKSGRNFVTYYGTVKYASATGNQEWVAEYKGPDNGGSDGFDVAVDGSGNVYVTGQSAVKTNLDYATVKYSQGTALKKGVTAVPTPEISNIFQLRNFPNPFNGNTTIEYQLPVEGKVKLSVFDLSGHEIATLVNENKPAGIHKINFKETRLSAGTYFYRLQTGQFSQTKSFIVLK